MWLRAQVLRQAWSGRGDCRSGVSLEEVLVQRQGTPQRPLLEGMSHATNVDPSRHQQVKQVAGITSSSFKHAVLDRGQDQEVRACVSL